MHKNSSPLAARSKKSKSLSSRPSQSRSAIHLSRSAKSRFNRSLTDSPKRGNTRRWVSTKPSLFSVLKSIVLPVKALPQSPTRESHSPIHPSPQPQQSQSRQQVRQQQVYNDFLKRRGYKAGVEMEHFEAMWDFLHSSLHHPNSTNSQDSNNPNKNSNYTHLDPEDHWAWAYNSHSGLHPSFPFLTPTQNTGPQISHFYSYPAPTTPVHITGVSQKEIHPHEKLVGIKGVDFLPNTTVYNRHLYHGGTVSYYNRLDLEQTVWWKLLPSTEPEHKFQQSKRNLIDHHLAISEEHLSKIVHGPQVKSLAEADSDLVNYNTNTGADKGAGSAAPAPNNYHPEPISVLKMHHLLYPHSKQASLVNLNPVPVVNQYIIPSSGNTDNAHGVGETTTGPDYLLRSRNEIPELKKDRHDVHIGYKVTGDLIDRWSRLNGNTNKLTLDQDYAQTEGFPGRLIPIQLLSTLALDGLHAVSKIIAPPKPVIFDAMEDLIVETRFEGFKQGFLEHIRDEAERLGHPIPEDLSPEQLEWVEEEFRKGNSGQMGNDDEHDFDDSNAVDDVERDGRSRLRGNKSKSNIPWHSTFQSLQSFVFEATRPIYLPVRNNVGEMEQLQTQPRGLIKIPQPTVYLDFYAQVSRDELNHDDYTNRVQDKMNDAMDYVDQLQQVHNPVDPEELTVAEIDSIPYKRLSILRSDDGKIHSPDPILTKPANSDGDEEMDAKISSFFSTAKDLDNELTTPKHSKSRQNDNKTTSVSRYHPNHEWDLTSRVYLPNEDALDKLVKYNDLLRDRPAFIKAWFTVRYDNPLVPQNENTETDPQLVETLEKCFLGFATFGSPPSVANHNTKSRSKRGYNLLTLDETDDTLAFVQGIEIIQDDGAYY